MMVKVVHWCALRISDVGMLLRSDWLFERGGALELWADEYMVGE